MELTEEMLRFFVAGVIATSVDFAGYNAFLRYVKRDDRVVASIFSVTLAMSISFLLNRFWVFSNLHPEGWPVIAFLAVTFTSAYGIQSTVIYGLSADFRVRLLAPLAGVLSDLLGVNQAQAAEVIERNAIKLVAIGAGLVWNFSWYRWYVFN